MPVDPTVMEIINVAQNATLLDPGVIVHSGNGKAYQSVAQSAAIAIQDATDALRNITTISTTSFRQPFLRRRCARRTRWSRMPAADQH